MYLLTRPREGATNITQGHWGRPGLGPRQEGQGQVQAGAFIADSIGKVGKGRANSVGWINTPGFNTRWNNTHGLQAIEVISCCLVSGPGVTQGRGNTGLVCESQIRRQLRLQPGLVGLCMRDVFLAEPFTSSKNRLALGEGSFSPSM